MLSEDQYLYCCWLPW